MRPARNLFVLQNAAMLFVPLAVLFETECVPNSPQDNDVHAEYGPVGFSFYTHIPTATRNIWIVRNPKVKLQDKYPAAKVTVVGSSPEHDFFYLMLAPILFKDASSSFGLWAGLANAGQVYSVPLMKAYNQNHSTTPDLGATWHWVDAPVLYPHVARTEGIARDAHAIIKWLLAH
eukprot:gene2432-2736_t